MGEWSSGDGGSFSDYDSEEEKRRLQRRRRRLRNKKEEEEGCGDKQKGLIGEETKH